jgi:hypothetical protein
VEGDDFMKRANVKEEAKRLIERLPEDATWDDLLRAVHARVSIETGLADSRTGQVTDVADVRTRFGLD